MPSFKTSILASSDSQYIILRSIIVGIISSLILLLSFKGDVVYYWDQGFIPYGTSNQLVSIFNLWIPQRGLGVLGGTINPFAIFVEIEYITSMFLPAWLSEFITIWIFYYLGGLGTIMFIEKLMKFDVNVHWSRKILIIIPTALFYYGVPWWWFGGGLFNPIQWPDIVAEGLMPFLFILTHDMFETISQGRLSLKYISLIYLLFILLIYNFNVWNLTLLLVYVPYVIYLSIIKVRRKKSLIILIFSVILVGFLVYLSSKPFIYTINLYTENFVRLNNEIIKGSLNIYEESSLNLPSILISPSLIPNFENLFANNKQPIFLFKYYENIFSNIISLIIFFIIIIPLISKKTENIKDYIIFVFILVSLIINLWMGIYSPAFDIIKYLFENFPVFVILKYPWVALDFMMPFLMAILFSYGVRIIIMHIKSKKKTVLGGLLLIILSISYGLPVLGGYGIETYISNEPSPYINNIQPYSYISQFINQNPGLNTVLVLPPTYSLYSTTKYLGLDIYYWLLDNKNIIDGGYLTSPGTHSLYWEFYSALLNHNRVLANNLLSILNVKYVILESDALYFPGGTMPKFNISEINESLTLLNLTYVNHYGNITLFKYNNPDGLFYSPSIVIIANSSQMIHYLSYYNYSVRNSLIITPYNNIYNLSSDQTRFLYSVIPYLHKAKVISISQINSENFHVIVNSSGPFLLVFSQTFSPYWMLYVNGTELPSQYHFVAYGFANAWFINKSGLLQIEVTLPVQKYVEYLYLKYIGISLLVLITIYIALKIVEVRRKHV
ncbi:hypothetical protein [Saccharolobus islandicus]|uniref:hypothetical protein n=1 Tax=Saccharolobus islandicus TaxID=43080 RepID=UPI003D7C6F60